MSKRTRKLSRRLRLAVLAPLGMWAWRYRHELQGAWGMVQRAPRQLLNGGADDLVTELRVRKAMAMDDLTRGNRGLEVIDVRAGQVRLKAASASTGTAARSIAEFVPGVTDVAVKSPGDDTVSHATA